LYLPDAKRDPKAEYDEAHIPGAVYFSIDEISDTSSPYPHMLPPPEKFASRVKAMGLGDGNRIVVYDSAGLFSAARVWWMFRVMGHEDVFVLDGGFPKWRAEGRPTEDLPPVHRTRHFTPRPNHLILRDAAQLRENLTTKREQVVDARSPGRFAGSEPNRARAYAAAIFQARRIALPAAQSRRHCASPKRLPPRSARPAST
jgi:thiosulfate/3-mercaptopyruvate sulfurtransferase